MTEDLLALVSKLKQLVCELESKKCNCKCNCNCECDDCEEEEDCCKPSFPYFPCLPCPPQCCPCPTIQHPGQLPYPPCTCPYYQMWLKCYCPQLFTCEEEDEESEDSTDSECEEGGNFYNNYNKDWHPKTTEEKAKDHAKYILRQLIEKKQNGVTLDGKDPWDLSSCPNFSSSSCGQKMMQNCSCNLPAVPSTTPKCRLNMVPPTEEDPCGPWKAELLPCCKHNKSNS